MRTSFPFDQEGRDMGFDVITSLKVPIFFLTTQKFNITFVLHNIFMKRTRIQICLLTAKYA